MEPKKNGKYEWKELNAEAYNKHVMDTPEFNNYVKGRKNPVSELTISAEQAQKLIDKYGHEPNSKNRGAFKFKSDNYIGYWADVDGNKHPTKNGRVSCSKKHGAHITPQRPDYLK